MPHFDDTLLFSCGKLRVRAAWRPPGAPTAPIVARLLAADPAVAPGAEVCHSPSGAPFLSGAGNMPAISITHSRDIVAIAVAPAGCHVGIDAENTGRDRQLRRVAPRFLSPSQLHLWGGTPQTLLRAWTLKEALYKAALLPGLPLIEIPLPGPTALPDSEVTLRGLRFALLAIPSPLPDNVISLARLADFSLND